MDDFPESFDPDALLAEIAKDVEQQEQTDELVGAYIDSLETEFGISVTPSTEAFAALGDSHKDAVTEFTDKIKQLMDAISIAVDEGAPQSARDMVSNALIDQFGDEVKVKTSVEGSRFRKNADRLGVVERIALIKHRELDLQDSFAKKGVHAEILALGLDTDEGWVEFLDQKLAGGLLEEDEIDQAVMEFRFSQIASDTKFDEQRDTASCKLLEKARSYSIDVSERELPTTEITRDQITNRMILEQLTVLYAFQREYGDNMTEDARVLVMNIDRFTDLQRQQWVQVVDAVFND